MTGARSASRWSGEWDVADIIGNAAHAARNESGTRIDAPSKGRERSALVGLRNVPMGDWLALCERAIEPNGYYLPDWERAVDASARGRTNVSAVCGRNEARALVALLPVVSAWRAFKLPLPVLVSADPYGDLGTPLLDGRAPLDAARTLLAQARAAGAHAIVLRHVTMQGAAMQAIAGVLAEDGLAPHAMRAERRACLDATRDADDVLREGLGAKKLKELRRQYNRLAELGPVSFAVAATPTDAAAALEVFLELEASGWKGGHGTALKQHEGDATFMRHATTALAARGECQIATLRAGAIPVAAGVVLRHQDRAFWFKVGVDERFAKYSPGVQLALALTRQLCADPDISLADSTALPGHPMIEPIWRGRLPIGEAVIPLYRNDPIVALAVAGIRALMRGRAQIRHVVRKLRTLTEKRR